MSFPSSPKTSTPNPLKPIFDWRTWLILLIAAAISMGGYLAASAIHLRIGFPLDDAWIHQTYSRNLALNGEWAFIPGQPSGGSTSPLWTAFLAVGHVLGLSPFIWTFFLGGILLTGLAILAEMGVSRIVDGYHNKIPWAGLLVIFEWHFVWSSASGMETLLHALLILVVCLLLIQKTPHWFILGCLIGLSVWVRPDGITLLGPIILTAFCIEKSWKKKSHAFAWTLLGFGILVFPYLMFNLSITGYIFPSTFYAKQAEYVDWQAGPLASRIGELALQFLAGPAILLLPGVVMQIRNAAQQKAWGQLSLFIWMLGYLSIYLLRLPVYQHGRYLIPAMPVFFFLGLGGHFRFFLQGRMQIKLHRLLKLSWGAALGLVCSGFWLMGMQSYTADVEFIETEMVDTAHWVAENLPEDALIAAHDIGALGYFDHHPLVDLAGLISPDVITFLRDEDRLADYLDEQGVEYLVAFPDWYPSLTSNLVPIFSTGASYAPSVGETNMVVYQWPGP